jgi:hypothetical protein
MKKLTLLISILLIVQSATAQIKFQKGYGGTNTNSGTAIRQTFDGGYITVGYTAGFGAGAFDIFVIKSDAAGIPVWKKSIGELGSDYANDVQQTSDSGFIFCGYSNSTFTGTLAGENIYLVKMNLSGNISWSKIIGGPGNDRANAIKQTSDGGFIVAGSTSTFGAGNKDLYLIKTDSNGNISWSKTFGGASDDEAKSVVQTFDGGYMVAGQTNSFGAGDIDYFIIKTDAAGNLTWSKTYGGINSDWLYSVQQNNDKGFILGGYSISFFGAGEADVLLIRTDSTGNIIWSKCYGGPYGEVATSLQITNSNGFIVAGGQSSMPFSMVDEGLLFKIDVSGNFQWANTFTIGNAVLSSVYKTNDGGYVATGEWLPFSGIDILIVKTDSNGISGCNEMVTSLTATDVFPQVLVPTLSSSTGGTASSVTSLTNTGGVVTNFCSSVSIEEQFNNDFMIAPIPNPTSGYFIISFASRIINGDVKILNNLGENIFEDNISNESKKEINLENISQGIYFVKVFDGEKSYCKKLIVEHD